jgi:hypothetical protein
MPAGQARLRRTASRQKAGPFGVPNETLARVQIEQLLRDTGWSFTDGPSLRFGYPRP